VLHGHQSHQTGSGLETSTIGKWQVEESCFCLFRQESGKRFPYNWKHFQKNCCLPLDQEKLPARISQKGVWKKAVACVVVKLLQ